MFWLCVDIQAKNSFQKSFQYWQVLFLRSIYWNKAYLHLHWDDVHQLKWVTFLFSRQSFVSKIRATQLFQSCSW